MDRAHQTASHAIHTDGDAYDALCAALATFFPDRTPQHMQQIAAIATGMALIESESLRVHLFDNAAILMQAEAQVRRSVGKPPHAP